MRMLSTDLQRRSTVWQLFNGGKAPFTAFCQYLHILLHGLGSNGVGARRYNGCGSMSVLNMTMLACGHAAHGHSMKVLRYEIQVQLHWRWFPLNVKVVLF